MAMPRVGLLGVITAGMLTPEDAFACSPPAGVDPQEFYAAINSPPYVLGAVSVACAAGWLLVQAYRRYTARRSRSLELALAVLAVAQPAWWIGTGSGDCGMLRDSAALVVALISLALFVVGLARLGQRPTVDSGSA